MKIRSNPLFPQTQPQLSQELGVLWRELATAMISPTIDGGTINNATIGATKPAAGTFTTLASETATISVSGARANMYLDGNAADADATSIAALWARNNVRTGAAEKRVAGIAVISSGATAGYRGASLQFITSIDSSSTLYERMRIHASGGVSIGNTTDPGAGNLSVTGTANSIPSEAVIAPTLLNSWVNFGSIYGNAGYWKDATGVVHLHGVVKSGTVGAAIFTLPSGYRPSTDQLFAVSSNALFGICRVSSGDVVAHAGSNISFSLDGITFRAA